MNRQGQPLKVALLGCGNVGSEVYRLIGDQAADLAARVGAPVQVAGVAVRLPGRTRGVSVDPGLIMTDAPGLVSRDDIDIVVEVIGGIEPARSLLLTALGSGKAVVTANKALLAEDGMTLHDAARAAGSDLYYEASVAGAIPLLRPLRESLAGDAVHRVLGIVNGTTDDILDRMDTSGAGFAGRAGRGAGHGYAEADPTADVEGFDAAAKAAILAALRSTPGSTPPTCTGRGSTGSPPPTSPARGRWAMWSSCWRSASAAMAGSRCGWTWRCSRARTPGGSARPTTWCSSRRSRGQADVLRGRGPVARRPRAPSSATSSRSLNRLADRGPDATTYGDPPAPPMGQALTRDHISRYVADKRARRPGRGGVRQARRVDQGGAPGGRGDDAELSSQRTRCATRRWPPAWPTSAPWTWSAWSPA